MAGQVEHLAEYYKECEEKYLAELPALQADPELWGMLTKYERLLKQIVELPEGYEMYAHSYLRDTMMREYPDLFNKVSEEKTYIIDYLDNVLITEESLQRYDMCQWYIKKTFEVMNQRSGADRWSMESVFAYSFEETYNFWGEEWSKAVNTYPLLLKSLNKHVQAGRTGF